MLNNIAIDADGGLVERFENLFQESRSTTALKKRLFGFRHVASDKPQGIVTKGGKYN